MLVDEEWMNVPITFPPAAARDLSDEALVVEVQMADEDEENTVFYTNQCRNLKAYIDDIAVKSKTEREMIADIMEMFDNLCRINMKLNPKKCSFGVEEGKFLGYMVKSEGIRVNPAKTKDIVEMHSPKTWAQMQSLSRKLAALNRFLARSAEKSLLPLKH
ncbi:reverse transcriptase domain-containing protein [Tanacetum coccineum]|uniref:Reverse transcriptase domain-containing protein n=1 Tax=Tanacetum coccineum TaxID=301880 RepID=A0ABQ5DXS6_9ASTR